MRTTIRLDDALLRRAKGLAAASGRSLNDFIADAVRAAVVPRLVASAPVQLPTFKGNGLQPGVDLDDGVMLRDLMDGDDVARYVSPASPPARVRKVAERARPGSKRGK